MRGFDSYRFHDAAAIYGCAELRVVPAWNPLRGGFLAPLEIDWLQFVGFGEVGRVAPVWNLGELTSDVKWDIGAGFRLMARRTIVRIDAAWSEEAFNVWVMVGQPFGLR